MVLAAPGRGRGPDLRRGRRRQLGADDVVNCLIEGAAFLLRYVIVGIIGQFSGDDDDIVSSGIAGENPPIPVINDAARRFFAHDAHPIDHSFFLKPRPLAELQARQLDEENCENHHGDNAHNPQPVGGGGMMAG